MDKKGYVDLNTGTVKQSDVCGYMGLTYKTGRLVTQLVQQDQAFTASS